jgi:HSPB1-associated protein 1
MAEHDISPKKRRLDIDRVHINLSQKELQRYILEIAKEPVVFLDKISDWKSLAWTPEILAKQLSDVRTRFRFCPRISSSEYCFPAQHAIMETDCHFVEGTFEDFYKWLTCDEANLQNSAFEKFPRKGKM